MINFCDYFEKVWVGVFDRNSEIVIKEPIYSLEFWNAHDRIRKNIPRTSNAAEAWNRILNLRSEVAHPNIAQFINELILGEEGHKFLIKRAEVGIFKATKTKLERENNINMCVQSFEAFKPGLQK